jgi:hypothetical protein
MRTVSPHEFFRLDFDKMLDEGKRQETIHPANSGEENLVTRMHAYFDTEVLPLIAEDDWVYEAAYKFATDYARDCFHLLQLTGQEAFRTQSELQELNRKIIDFLARAHLSGAAPLAGQVDLAKASDFQSLLLIHRLSRQMRLEAGKLLEQATDHESLQLWVTLRGIRATYEISLPRIMYVVRRAIKVSQNLSPRPSDDDLIDISSYISWYKAYVSDDHALNPVLGELDTFYKVARNVGSHHHGLEWVPESNEVVLRDRHTVLKVPVHLFQQKYRHLTYVCELGLRGILSAFCRREQGNAANQLVKSYIRTFPEDFPPGEPGRVRFYPG